jgi:hypothetical protein
VPSNTNLATGTSNFTVEAWVYTSLTSGTQCVYDTRQNNDTNTGFYFGLLGSNTLIMYTSAAIAFQGGTAPANTWAHIALVRNGNTFTGYLNGTSVGTATSTNNFTNTIAQIGASTNVTNSSVNYLTGYISNLRVVKGTALYTSNFAPPIAPVAAVQNTVLLLNGTSAAIADATTKNVLETVGDVRISTAVSKFGGSSMFFDGSGDYLVVPHSSLLDFGSANFTIECWINSSAASVEQLLFGKRASSANYAPILFGLKPSGGTNRIYILGSTTGSTWNINSGFNNGATAIPVNTWTHIACVRNGTTITGYVNGVSDFTLTGISGSLMTNTNNATIGAASLAGDSPVNGYMQDFRITQGTARYTANFTPPATAFFAS